MNVEETEKIEEQEEQEGVVCGVTRNDDDRARNRSKCVRSLSRVLLFRSVVPSGQDGLVAKTPFAVGRQLLNDTATRHSIVFSNVRGPDKAARFAGGKLNGLQMVFANPIPQVRRSLGWLGWLGWLGRLGWLYRSSPSIHPLYLLSPSARPLA